MLKKFLIAVYIILATSLTVHGADKWTGPTSSLDPMWGLKGSSVMAEILRDNTVQTYTPLQSPRQQQALEDAYEQGKRDGRKSSYYDWRN